MTEPRTNFFEFEIETKRGRKIKLAKARVNAEIGARIKIIKNGKVETVLKV